MTPSKDEEILTELQRVTRLLALIATRGEDNQGKRIIILSDVGFQAKEIAELLHTTPNTVNVTLSQRRRKHGARKQKTLKRMKSIDK